MLAPKRPSKLRFVQSRVVSKLKSGGSLRAAALLILFGLLATTLYLPSSATSFHKRLDSRTANVGDKWKASEAGAQGAALGSSLLLRKGLDLTSLMAPPLSPEGIATFNADCTTPNDSFNLGQTVCAKASGVPVSLFPWHVAWLNTSGLIVQSDVASTDGSYDLNWRNQSPCRPSVIWRSTPSTKRPFKSQCHMLLFACSKKLNSPNQGKGNPN